MDEVGPPPTVSNWWWLIPPLRLWIGHHRKQDWDRKIWTALPDEQFEALSAFMSKARGWLLVGGGGLLIAVKETWELVEGHEWATWVFWVLIVAMAFGCVAYTALQASRESARAEKRVKLRAEGQAAAASDAAAQ